MDDRVKFVFIEPVAVSEESVCGEAIKSSRASAGGWKWELGMWMWQCKYSLGRYDDS